MTKRPFRTRDKITVHWGKGKTSKGRVICHNRRNKYGLSVIILFETPSGGEVTESFLPNGKRWSSHDSVYITHGWEDKDTD